MIHLTIIPSWLQTYYKLTLCVLMNMYVTIHVHVTKFLDILLMFQNYIELHGIAPLFNSQFTHSLNKITSIQIQRYLPFKWNIPSDSNSTDTIPMPWWSIVWQKKRTYNVPKKKVEKLLKCQTGLRHSTYDPTVFHNLEVPPHTVQGLHHCLT